jgi:hypothetical protein
VLKVNGQPAQRYEPTTDAPNVIGGWAGNSVQSGLYGGTIGGGGSMNLFDYGQGLKPQPNLVTNNAEFGTIAGGYNNIVGGYGGAISGGSVHRELGSFGVIGGGQFHTIESNASYAVIGGGYNNAIRSNSATSVIVAGHDSQIINANYSFIGGGGLHSILSGAYDSFIGAGGYAYIGTNAHSSFIGGGGANVILDNASYATIPGGQYNTIGSNAFYAVISGGIGNSNSGAWSVTAGGYYNTNSGIVSFIGAGDYNITGTNAAYSFVGGGYYNSIEGYTSFLGGGAGNTIDANSSYGFIGGGINNTNGGYATTVPGGVGNFALGSYSFAAGHRAKAVHTGSFVWADSTDADFFSSNTNQFNIRAGGGFRLETGGAAATLNGQPLLSGSVPANALSGTYPNAVTFNNVANSFSGDGSGLTGLNASALSSGTVSAGRLSGSYNINITGTAATATTAANLNGRATNNFWTTTGNSGTSPFANFIGTSDGANLLIKGGFVGVGRTSPITPAEAFGVDAPAGAGFFGGMYVNTTGANALPFYGYATGGTGRVYHYVDGGDAFKWKLYTGSVTPAITVTALNQVGIANTAPTNLFMVSNARCDGSTWINASDRNLKENFAAVNPREILEKVVSMPITKWNYKKASDTHLGPVAQDFHEQFKLGSDDKSIATVDESGVALAAIQGLNQKLEQEVKKKDARIGDLEKRLAALEAAMQRK